MATTLILSLFFTSLASHSSRSLHLYGCMASNIPLSQQTTSTRLGKHRSFSAEMKPDDGDGTTTKGSSKLVRHYCFLVHGVLGDDSELAYVETALNREFQAFVASDTTGTSSTNETRDKVKLIVHKTASNNGNTLDGVVKGGTRLANEVREFIRSSSENENRLSSTQEEKTDVVATISFVGNSLGGIYARYAIGVLHTEGNSDKDWNFNVFCTTATPHLGCSSHTYLPLPRFLERGISVTIQKTGRDLFRNNGENSSSDNHTNDIIQALGLQTSYILPLSKFERRIAFANAFKTDLQVPTDTAAFLCSESLYPHTYVSKNHEDKDKDSCIVAEFETEKRSLPIRGDNSSVDENIYTKISESLDALGWRKVFVDVRDLIPIPKIRVPFSSKESARPRFERILEEKMRINNSAKGDNKESSFEEHCVFKSKELASYLCPASTDKIPLFPFGHTVMVANSKSAFYERFNKGGRVVMDYLAKIMVEEIMKWNFSPTEDT